MTKVHALLLSSLLTFACATQPDEGSPTDATGLTDLACVTDADCCVVYASCHDTLVLVTAKNRDSAEAAFTAMKTKPDPNCWPCVPPAVEVSCRAGRCVAERLGEADPFELRHTLSAPHCGSQLKPDGGAPASNGLTTHSAALSIDAGDVPPPISRFSCH
jgi:hypothetical protein